MGLFSKTPRRTPKEQVREWTSKLRRENLQLDRQIRGIKREEEKVKRSLKEAAKKGDRDVCKILAKEVVNARKSVNRIYSSKAQINSVVMSMNQQLATIKIAGAMEKSTEVMKSMQSLIKLPEVAKTMQEMSKEMMKAGIIEEMLEDTMEGLEPDDMEEEVEDEVEKVLFELTAGQLVDAPSAVSDTLPSGPEGATADVEEESDEDVTTMQARLEALRS